MITSLPLVLGFALATLQDPAPARTPEEDPQDILVVTPTGSETPAQDVPFSVETLDARILAERSQRHWTLGLRDVPGVLVQQTASGQVSPYIRGFTGFQTLALVDGVRLNNSVFRSGPNQYWATIDSFSIDHLELVKGPASVLYGSDAIGGTVNLFTRTPFAWEEGFGLRSETRWAEAESSIQQRLEASVTNGSTTGLLLGLSYKDFGDVRGGHEVGLQENTGYDEFDADLKLEHSFADGSRLTVAHQFVRQEDVPRTHTTIFGTDWEGLSVGSELRRDHDQARDLTYARLEAEDAFSVFDTSVTTLSAQRQAEERDRLRTGNRRDLQGTTVNTLGFSQVFTLDTGLGDWTLGADVYRDRVDSFIDKFASQSPADDIQGPVADDASYLTAGLFAEDRIKVTSRLDLSLGARLNHAAIDANEVLDPVTLAQTSIEDDWTNLVGSARFGYDLKGKALRLFGGISQGFRAPNLSDLTRLDSARSNEFEVAALDLGPEYTVSYELGLKQEGRETRSQLALFFTDIQDGIVRTPTGQVNGDGETIVTKSNVGDGTVFGVEASGAWRVAADLELFGNATWLEGEQDVYPTSAAVIEREPLSRLMPPSAFAGVRWTDQGRPLWVEFLVRYAARADRLSTSDESDATRIPPGGTPGFVVADLHTGYRLRKGVDLLLGIDNLANADYRIHGSGLNGPGRNLYVTLRLGF